jgi:hypothetical protein
MAIIIIIITLILIIITIVMTITIITITIIPAPPPHHRPPIARVRVLWEAVGKRQLDQGIALEGIGLQVRQGARRHPAAPRHRPHAQASHNHPQEGPSGVRQQRLVIIMSIMAPSVLTSVKSIISATSSATTTNR